MNLSNRFPSRAVIRQMHLIYLHARKRSLVAAIERERRRGRSTARLQAALDAVLARSASLVALISAEKAAARSAEASARVPRLVEYPAPEAKVGSASRPAFSSKRRADETP
ncbi:hypothetical protein [Piscinibacter koreensis]|uniref:Uncharacterized protein n=1 Tax=Piscinibacter koreensis TaxID=2742824 RepID=A0A7Y6NTN7_9BURK|nr:hypothetical protein [Schlegelella koreensis]NUZ09136.1 hypothetical protein [Schlegelella koreensis]